MAHPAETVIEAIQENLRSYEPPNAKALADTIAFYALIAEQLRGSIVLFSQHVAERAGIDPQTKDDLNDMATAAEGLFWKADEAKDNFWDNHRFWLEQDEGS